MQRAPFRARRCLRFRRRRGAARPRIDAPTNVDRLDSKTYGGIVCASLLLDEPLGPYYVTNLTDDMGPVFGRHRHGQRGRPRSEWNGTSARLSAEIRAPRRSDLRRKRRVARNALSRRARTDVSGILAAARPRVSHLTGAARLSDRDVALLADACRRSQRRFRDWFCSTPRTSSTARSTSTKRLDSSNADLRRSMIACGSRVMKPLGSLSLDLDNEWAYIKTHGDPAWESFPSYLDVVVPRFLDILARLDQRITVFVVGQDAALEKNRAALALLAPAGHEIGNHSFHHEPWLRRYSDAQIEEEIVSAQRRDRRRHGCATRSDSADPASASPRRTLEILAAHGFRYDCSTFPTYIGPLARAYYFMTAKLTPEERERRKELFGTFADGLRPLRTYRWNIGAGRSLVEIPVTTFPLLKMPIHFSYVLYLATLAPGACVAVFPGGAVGLPSAAHHAVAAASSARFSRRRGREHARVLPRNERSARQETGRAGTRARNVSRTLRRRPGRHTCGRCGRDGAAFSRSGIRVAASLFGDDGTGSHRLIS